MRLLARLSASPVATAVGSSAPAPLRALRASSRQHPSPSSLLPGRNVGGAACRAPFSSTTARPSEDAAADEEDEAGEGSGGAEPARKAFDGGVSKGRPARRHDGDKVRTRLLVRARV